MSDWMLYQVWGIRGYEVVRQVRYLKVENEILRSMQPARITITPKERQRLVKFGAKLGRALHELVAIVTPERSYVGFVRRNGRVGNEPNRSGVVDLEPQKRSGD